MAWFLGRSMPSITYGRTKKLAICLNLCRWIGRLAQANPTPCHGEKKIQRSQFFSCSIQRWFEQPPMFFPTVSPFYRRLFGASRTLHWCHSKHARFASHHNGAAENHSRGRNQPGAFAEASNLTSFFGQGCIWLWLHQTQASCSVPPSQIIATIRLSCRLFSRRKETQDVQESHWLTSFWPLDKKQKRSVQSFRDYYGNLEASLGILAKIQFFQLFDWGKDVGPIHSYIARLCHLLCQPFFAIQGTYHCFTRCVAWWISWYSFGGNWNRKRFFRATPSAGDGERWRVFFMVDPHKQRETCTCCFGRKKSDMVVGWNRAAFALLALKKSFACHRIPCGTLCRRFVRVLEVTLH